MMGATLTGVLGIVVLIISTLASVQLIQHDSVLMGYIIGTVGGIGSLLCARSALVQAVQATPAPRLGPSDRNSDR